MADGAGEAATYELLLAVEELEALREELAEQGVASAAELAGLETPAAAALLAELRRLGLPTAAALEERIADLHRRLDERE